MNSELKQLILEGNMQERPMKITLSLQSVAISLVNDILGLEVACIHIPQYVSDSMIISIYVTYVYTIIIVRSETKMDKVAIFPSSFPLPFSSR